MSKITHEERKWIDTADYITLLRKWRFEPATSLYFSRDAVYNHFSKRLNMLGLRMTNEERVKISRKIGWKKGK
jgi:hypothetical protein